MVAVCPPIATQDAPPALQRCQEYAYVIVGEPSQVPWLSDRTCASWAVPVTAGGVTTNGASAVTTAVWGEVAVAVPPALVPVTTTRIVEPMSATTCVYVDAVAPPMSAQLLPEASQRRHW